MENYQKISNTIQEMMNDRNYSVTKIFDYKFIDNDALFFPMLIANKNNESIIVYITYKKIGKKEIIKFQELIQDNHVILLSKYDLTSQAKKIIMNKDVNIELFLHKQVIFNIIKHDLQPKFILLTIEELTKLCDEFQCTISELPKMSINDPIARYYNAKTKNVFKIIRPENIYFRVVV